jgi:hypothetical protein
MAFFQLELSSCSQTLSLYQDAVPGFGLITNRGDHVHDLRLCGALSLIVPDSRPPKTGTIFDPTETSLSHRVLEQLLTTQTTTQSLTYLQLIIS